MQISFDLLTVIVILGAVQGAFLSLLIFTQNQKNKLPRIFLSLLLFFLSLLLFLIAMFQARQVDLLIIIGPVILPLMFTMGPLLYFYTKSLTDKEMVFSFKDYFHFIPYVVLFIIMGRLYLIPYQEQLEFINQFYMTHTQPFDKFFRYADAFSRAIYTVFALIVLYRYREQLKNEYSFIEHSDYRWLRHLLILSLITILFLVILTIFNIGNNVRILVGIYFSVLMYIIGYKYVKEKVTKQPTTVANKSKYEKSGLTDERKQEIKKQLEDLMHNEKIYREPEVSAGKLAEILEVSQNHLSQVINELFGKNFYEFINYYRIEEAKKLLVDKKSNELSILAIAFEVGFQSKSTFNSVFKKFTKATPSQFRNSHSK